VADSISFFRTFSFVLSRDQLEQEAVVKAKWVKDKVGRSEQANEDATWRVFFSFHETPILATSEKLLVQAKISKR
jgi:hypothetical protein